MTEPKTCKQCGSPITPRVYPGGQRERPSILAKRKYCSEACRVKAVKIDLVKAPPGVYCPLVVCWGGGVNSTAILAGCYEKQIRVDMIIFSDTGGEKPETYAYMKEFSRFLLEVGFPPITVVSAAMSLEQRCLKNATLPSLAFGGRACSSQFKREPQEKFLNHHPLAKNCWKRGYKIRKAIGYDAGEERRRNKAPDEDAKYVYEYPLMDWGWHREDCVAAIRRVGLSVPMKSSCFFCPATRKKEIFWLRREHPELVERALAMESRALASGCYIAGLGRAWSWADVIQAKEQELAKFDEGQDLPCGCFDGEDPPEPCNAF